MTRILLLCCLLAVGGCAKDHTEECTGTCIADGIAVTADVCSEELLRWQSCEAPDSVREPVVGELVRVLSFEEYRESIVLSVSEEGFAVAGPPAGTELGSSVVADSDGALLGLVQSYSSTISICSVIR
jgi:hypothetical protein